MIMKITKIEKIVFGLIVAIIVLIVSINIFVFNEVKKNGGVKAVIINASKELKDIKKEIDKE